MKIALIFSEKQFEYDLYHLVQAFYPEAEMTIGYEQMSGWFLRAPERLRACQNGSPHEGTNLNKTAFPEDESDTYDLTFRIFYDGDTITIAETDRSGTKMEDIRLSDPADRTETKNQLKKLVYSSLVARSGHPLPWGDLSGIRPVKLVTGLLESGASPEAAQTAMQERYGVSPKKAALACEIAVREQELLGTFEYRSGYSLYIDIPFCPSICLYCTFGSHPIGQWRDTVPAYFSALFHELARIAELMRGRRLDTVYIGGGTPTSVEPAQMDRLLNEVTRLFPLGDLREFTVEAGRPDTITEEMLRVLQTHPVTRISINPQTMHQNTLDLIGRGHTVEQTREAFRTARRLGFDHINMDMIVGLPHEGAEETAQTLREIEALAPDALTVHSLALKRAARLNLDRDVWRPVSFANSAAIMEETEAAARRMRMEPYYLYRQKNMAGNFENIGYAEPGKACLYNILVMEEKQTILGAGCGAATKRILSDGTKAGRVENVKSLREYLLRTDEMVNRKEGLFGE